MPLNNRSFQFNQIQSEFWYNIFLKSYQKYIYDSQSFVQVGTDKDWVEQNPDIYPSVQSGLDDTNCIWVSWTGNNANAGTQANPKRSLTDNAYNSAGTGAINKAITDSKANICFVTGSVKMWVEPAIIPLQLTIWKYQSGDTPILRTCKRTLPNGGNFTDANTRFVDPNVVGPGSGTQADPYKSLAYAAISGVPGITNIMIFNSGVSGTPGDFISLEFNECMNISKTFEIYVGIQFATNWYTAGDTAIINYIESDNNCLAIGNHAPYSITGGKYCISDLASPGWNTLYYPLSSGRIGVLDDIFAGSVMDTGSGNTSKDCKIYGSYIYVSHTNGVRRSLNISPIAWGNSITGVGCTDLIVFNGYLYGNFSTTLRKTSDGTTWNTVQTIISASFFTIFQSNLYFIDNNLLKKINTSDEMSEITYPEGNWDEIINISASQDYLYISVKTNNELYVDLYKYDGYSFVLVNREDYVVDTWNLYGNLINYDDNIYLKGKQLEINLFYKHLSLKLANDNLSGVPSEIIKDLFYGSFILPVPTTVDTLYRFFPNLIINLAIDVKISGIELNGNDLGLIGIIDGQEDLLNYTVSTGLVVENCNIHNFIYAGIQKFTNSHAYNNIFHDMQYAIKYSNNGGSSTFYDKMYNLIYNMTEKGFEEIGSGQIRISNNIFDNAKIGIDYQNSAIDVDSVIELNVFSRVGQPVKTLTPTPIELISCIIPPNCKTTGITLDENSISGIPLYRDRNNADFRLQAIGDNDYKFDSVGVNLDAYATPMIGNDVHGDAYTPLGLGDTGCYTILRAVYSWVWENNYRLNPFPETLEINPLFKVKTSFDTKEGSTRKNYKSIKKQFIFSWSEDNPWSYVDIQNLINLLRYSYKMGISFNTPDDEEFDFSDQAGWLASQLRTDIINHKVGLYSGQDSNVFTKADMTLVTSNSWLTNQWEGYYVTIIDKADQETGGTFHPRISKFYIISNDATTLYLENKNKENLGKYSATVNVATNDLMFIISDILAMFDVDNDLGYKYKIYKGANINDEIPRNIISQLKFEEIL